MATSPSDSLDTLIVKATNPLVDNPDPVLVASFCEKVNHEFDGPQVASRLLAYRIHSPQEKEALHALALLEQCVKSCGPSFRSEIGKFRFLNELIKLVSPRYQAHRTPNIVKQRILDILYTWTIDLKSEPKIQEAYDMLKKQGVIKETPKYLGTSSSSASETVTPLVPRPKNPIFEDSEKQALLQKLLQSKNQEDLQAANRLIKSMVREEERRQEMASRRHLEIETVNSNLRLLEELIDNFETNGATNEEMDLCKELATNCDKMRSNLSRLAAEMDDKEDGIDDILRASDELSRVLERFESLSKTVVAPGSTAENSSASLDLLDLGQSTTQPPLPSSSLSVLDEQLLSLGLDDVASINAPVSLLQPLKPSSTNPVTSSRIPEQKIVDEPRIRPKGLEELDALGEILLKQSLPNNAKSVGSFQKPPEKVPLSVLAQQKTSVPITQTPPVKNPMAAADFQNAGAVVHPTASSYTMDFDFLAKDSMPASSSQAQMQPEPDSLLIDYEAAKKNPNFPSTDGAKSVQDSDVSLLDTTVCVGTENTSEDVQMLQSPPATVQSAKTGAPPLGDVSVKFHEIKPSSQSPIILLEQVSGMTVTLHGASAQGIPKDVAVFVVSTTSSNPSPIANYTFQAVVPKGCRVKLQPPSDSKLPAFNPFLPPPAITQIMLISTPGLNLIELKFVVSFDMDGETTTEMGSISQLALFHNSI